MMPPYHHMYYKGSYARPGPARDSNISIATAPPQAPRGDWDDLFADSRKREAERKVLKGKKYEEEAVVVEEEEGGGVHSSAQGKGKHRRKRTGSNVTV